MARISLADLSLFPATREQMLESRRRHHVMWSRGLRIDEYQLRDVIMDGQEHAADGRLITWVLAPRDDPHTLDFMSSCETYRRIGIAAKRDAIGEVEVADVPCYGIASVFCPAEKRGNGYGQHMMHLLHWVLASHLDLPVFPTEWGVPPERPATVQIGDARFSVLYSDIGKVFYRAAGPDKSGNQGWLVSGSTETSYYPKTSAIPLMTSTHKWQWLSEDEVKGVWEKDAQLLKEDLHQQAAASERVLFAFLPNRGVGDFSIQRTMGITYDRKPTLASSVWGVQLPRDIEDGRLTFATWTLDIRDTPKTLIVTRIRASEEFFPQLLEKIVEASREHDVEKIEIWGLREPQTTLAERSGWETSERGSHLSAYKWYGKESDEQLEWAFNERFCWC